jgi:hypothetical protein
MMKKAVKRTAAPKKETDLSSGSGPVWVCSRTAGKNAVPAVPVLSLEDFQGKKTKAEKDFRIGVAVGDQDMPPIGVPFPSFCWEMFFRHSVLPAASCYALGGLQNSWKSHLAMEMARWIIHAGGITFLEENENKYNPDMPVAVMGVAAARQVIVKRCGSFNEVQNGLVEQLETYRKLPSEKQVPFLQIVDSVVGNSTQSQQKSLVQEGEIERGYPLITLAAANFLPSYMPMLSDLPVFGLWIN